jgi:hypothetical protein
VWARLQHQDSFTLSEAYAVIQQWWSLRLQPNPPEYIWRYATHLLLIETWVKFGLRHHGLYYAYPAEYCMHLERQWHAINDLVNVQRFLTLLRPLATDLLESLEIRYNQVDSRLKWKEILFSDRLRLLQNSETNVKLTESMSLLKFRHRHHHQRSI